MTEKGICTLGDGGGVCVSVVVPVYNVGGYLRKCLDSLLKQTLREIEVVCVDDGSTDDSPKILAEYARKDSRIRVIRQENGGPGSARNTGIRAARGEYVGFVDPDDFVSRNYYEKLYSAAKEHDADVASVAAYSRYKSFWKQSRAAIFAESDTVCVSPEDRRKATVMLSVWLRIYRKEFLAARNLFFPENTFFGEDSVVTILSAFLANKIICVHGACYYYRSRPGSLVCGYAEYKNKMACAYSNLFKEIDAKYSRIPLLKETATGCIVGAFKGLFAQAPSKRQKVGVLLDFLDALPGIDWFAEAEKLVCALREKPVSPKQKFAANVFSALLLERKARKALRSALTRDIAQAINVFTMELALENFAATDDFSRVPAGFPSAGTQAEKSVPAARRALLSARAGITS